MTRLSYSTALTPAEVPGDPRRTARQQGTEILGVSRDNLDNLAGTAWRLREFKGDRLLFYVDP